MFGQNANLGWGPRLCISKKLPGYVDAEGRQTTQSSKGLETLTQDKTGLNSVYGSGNCVEHKDVKCVKGYSSNLGNQLGIEGDARVTAALRFEDQRTGKKLAFLGEMRNFKRRSLIGRKNNQ